MTPISDLFPPHPTLAQPSPKDLAKWTPEQVLSLSRTWRDSIANATKDPLRKGFHPKHWKDALKELKDPDIDGLTVFGGNRGMKTEFGCWVVMRALLENPGTTIFCWCQSKDISQLVQQPRMFSMLPPELRARREDESCSIHFKIATGFVNDRFTLPNGSVCMFWYYTQFSLNPNLIEGIEIGWKGKFRETCDFPNVGNWFDEYLIGPALMNTVEERLSTRNAKSLTTFTPIYQYTEAVEEILDGVETVKDYKTLKSDPEQIRGLTVPYIQRKPSRAVIYFATRKNPFHNYERSKRNMIGKPRDWTLMKLYGVPTKISANKFPMFSRDTHVIKELPDDVDFTRYMVASLAGDSPWFLIWVAVTPDGTHYIYREWPKLEEHGAWAERRDGDWTPGPAATGASCGLGFRSYARIIKKAESEPNEEILERYVNPDATMPGDSASSIIGGMEDEGIDLDPTPDLPEQEAIQRIQEMVRHDYGEEHPPKLKILDCCENLIRSLTGYDVPQGETNPRHAWKAPFSCLLFMGAADLDYVGEDVYPEELSEYARAAMER